MMITIGMVASKPVIINQSTVTARMAGPQLLLTHRCRCLRLISLAVLLLLVSDSVGVDAFHPCQQRWSRSSPTAAAAVPSEELLSSTLSISSSASSALTRYLAPTVSSFFTYFALAAAYDRPQGKMFVGDGILVARQSQVPGAGLGLYSTEPIPEGTALGTYPGVVREANAYLKKYGQFPQCGSYAWRFTDNASYVDPTDAAGNIGELCFGGSAAVPGSIWIHENLLSGLALPTLLARINEPPIGGPGCNVFSREDLDSRTITFYASIPIPANCELFMDYGLTYDRTNYRG
mmetsp:Transcript_2425/g.7048  ORF Transcript_2425/g.7048 Transcript_2425/m.7048 type:complete len:291 (+) Transcript_2425:141-1013(+)